jgi:uncharacterized protein YcnI
MKKLSILGMCLSLALYASAASAHVVVHPDTVGIAAYQTFSVSVPSETDLATTGLRLVLPDGLASVSPTVKPGWRIEVKTKQVGDAAVPAEIDWTGGSIPGHFRDDFTFSAKTPATEGTLAWKAYQTYSDGSVVAWDADPATLSKNDSSGAEPYSQTQVVNDLDDSATSAPSATTTKTDKMPVAVATLAFVFSLAALVMASRKKV